MKLRRAGIVSLMLAVMAMAGASVAPARGADGRLTAVIVWQAREDRRTPVVREQRGAARTRTVAQTTCVGSINAGAPCAPVRHALFQRPPPIFSSTTAE